ncbi:MAG TPA: hypothetical protein EYP41_04865 [Anaerolineae bacterium]|nr:hypothetical protein [Anaerolineae bacterium]HIP73591.1 hypothetical protein [Anaerolineae bacterium]
MAPPRFAVCLDNAGYEASLETGKLYRILPDADGNRHGYIRIIDESGEDYLYTSERFFPLTLPQTVAETLLVSGD